MRLLYGDSFALSPALRQWFVKRFNIWQHEMDDTNELIQSDVRNNSAWNHRFFVMKCAPAGPSKPDVRTETLYAMEKILLAPSNESPWQYLRGCVFCVFARSLDPRADHQTSFTERIISMESDEATELDLTNYPHVLQFCLDLLQKGTKACPLYSFLAEHYETQAALQGAGALDKARSVGLSEVHRLYR